MVVMPVCLIPGVRRVRLSESVYDCCGTVSSDTVRSGRDAWVHCSIVFGVFTSIRICGPINTKCKSTSRHWNRPEVLCWGNEKCESLWSPLNFSKSQWTTNCPNQSVGTIWSEHNASCCHEIIKRSLWHESYFPSSPVLQKTFCSQVVMENDCFC